MKKISKLRGMQDLDPTETRKYLKMALAAVYNSEIKGSDSFGVFRM